MDGPKQDADILFVVTTNRSEDLESALASRPGRIDQAIKVPLPDDIGRRKLVRLYGKGLPLDEDIVKEAARRTSGVSAAFIKELMRRIAHITVTVRRALTQQSTALAGSISSGYGGLAIRISMRYVLLVIRSFKGKFAEPILQGRMVPKGFPANLAKVARRKLIMVDAAAFLEALNSSPGNRLEALKGDLAGKHAIRINDQWRVVFRWTDAGPEDVEIIDYH